MNRFNIVRPTDINLPNIQIPLEYLNQTAQRSQQIYDTSKQVRDQNIQHLSQHSTEAGQLRNDITTVSDEIAKKYTEGNVEDANRYALQTLNNVAKEFKQGGRGYALGSAYATYQQGVKDIVELNKNTPGGDINTAVALDEYAKSIKPIADNGDGLGYTHTVSANPRAYKYFNKSKALFDQIKVVDPDIKEQDFIGLMDKKGNLDPDKQQWISRLKEKGFDQEKINAIFDGLTSDPAWRQQSEVEAKYTVMQLGEDKVKAALKDKGLAQTDYLISLMDNMNSDSLKTNLASVSGIDTDNMTNKELQQTYAQWKIDAKNKVNNKIDNKDAVELLIDEDTKIQKHRFESLLPTEKSITYHANSVFMDYEKMRHSDRQAAARRKFERDQQEREWKRNDELNTPLLTPREAVPEKLNIDALTSAKDQVASFDKETKTFFDKLYKGESSRIGAGPRRDTAEKNLISAYGLAMRESDPTRQAEVFKKNLSSDNSQWIGKLHTIAPQLGEYVEMSAANESAKSMVSMARNIDIPIRDKGYKTYADAYKAKYKKGISKDEFLKLAKTGKLETIEVEITKDVNTGSGGIGSIGTPKTYKTKKVVNYQQEYDDAQIAYLKEHPDEFEAPGVRITTINSNNSNSPAGKASKQLNAEGEKMFQNLTTLDNQKIKWNGGEKFISLDVPASGGSASDYLVLTVETPATIVRGSKGTKTYRVQRPAAMKPYIDALVNEYATSAAKAGDLNTFGTIVSSLVPDPNYAMNKQFRYTGEGDYAKVPMKLASGESTGSGFVVVHDAITDEGNRIAMVRDGNDNYRVGQLANDATGKPVLVEFSVSGVDDSGPKFDFNKTSLTSSYDDAFKTLNTATVSQDLILKKIKR